MSKALLTIIVPTLNRSAFIIRLLNYLAHTNYKHCIAIGDSSDGFHVEKTKEAIKTIGKKLEIVYSEFPGLSCHATQKQLIQSVATPYIVSLPDDDFLVPDGLDKCIEFLETHPDYVAAHGVGVIVTFKAGEPYGKDLLIDNYRQPIIEKESATERLVELLEKYSVPVFSVHRTAAFRVMWFDKIDNYAFGELLPCCLSVILGKIKHLNGFYLVRQNHGERYLSPDLYDWITNARWQSSYEVLQNCLTEELSKRENITLDEAKQIFKQGFWAYLIMQLSTHYKGQYEPTILVDIKQVVKNIPFVNNILRSILRSIRQQWLSTGNISLPALLNPRSPYHNDFMPIYRAIRNAPEKAGKE